MRSTNELPRSIARARGAVGRAQDDERSATYFTRPYVDMYWPAGARFRAERANYEWARAAAALLAWGLS